MNQPSTVLFRNVKIDGTSVDRDDLKSAVIGAARIDGNVEEGVRYLQYTTVTRQIRSYNPDGTPTGQKITRVPQASSIAVHPDGRLFVADDGSDQQIKIFDVSGSNPRKVGTMGPKGGVFSGTPGKYGPYKLNGPNAIDIDEEGNIYVASGGKADPWDDHEYGSWANWHTDLRAYSGTQDEGGELLWKTLGLMFVDAAVVDPRSHSDLYTMETLVTMDWSPMPGEEGYEPGMEWGQEYDQIHNGFKYPDDPRHIIGGTNPLALRYIEGEPIMFTTNMGPKFLAGFRLRAEGEVSKPATFVATNAKILKGRDWPEEAPGKPGQGTQEFLWTDRNVDGHMQEKEFEKNEMGGGRAGNGGWDVDADGNIWHVSANSIDRLPLQGLNDAKAPEYDMSALKEYDFTEPFTQVSRQEYAADRDTLFVMGYTKNHPEEEFKAGTAGPMVARYDGWVDGDRELVWKQKVPFQFDPRKRPSGFYIDEAGWLYVGYGVAPERGLVRIYSSKTGELIGKVTPGPNVDEYCGLLDIKHPVQAFKRENGERILMVEENGKGRILVYRIKSPAKYR